ncbi:ABC transporter ATP-binding protein [Profundibacterium mesophilum]|uniref:Peptide ABC transporter ATP-binding protein n=1 Tax=Profundibacterium mesophilum KAUST100406-0324 TaxID=1037889 RepID=A0A921TCU1_9RHOB|nr:dipeptide ABC transporter ATP-binding protein [Profundibacterium mesophilum]KAF0676078.1 Peptide ABC transporter ATP-binding protein [Profundibacterium mesophilum KAUST100406-0324]
MSDVILRATGLRKHFRTGGGMFARQSTVRAVDGVTLDVRRGETFAIVGESGCGKSTLARLLMRLLEPTDGRIDFDGRDISDLKGRDLRDLRREMQFIFQDPFSSLNPRMSVGRLVAEPLETHHPQMGREERREEVARLLGIVGLRPEHADRYPHEFSGGQRQRIGIARALASRPRLVIGDEPVSALDVSVQAQVVNLLHDLKAEFDMTLVIIAHDLAVIRHMSDRVAVMYLGQIVETGTTDDIFAHPRHPYTMALLSAIPEPVHGRARTRLALSGETPSPANPPSGCRFHTRCPFAREDCAQRVPELRPAGPGGQHAACHYWEEIAAERPDAGTPPAHERKPQAAARFALYEAAIDRLNDRPETAVNAGANDMTQQEEDRR